MKDKRRGINWKDGKLIEPVDKNDRLLVFCYQNGDEDHPQIIECDKVKTFSKQVNSKVSEK